MSAVTDCTIELPVADVDDGVDLAHYYLSLLLRRNVVGLEWS